MKDRKLLENLFNSVYHKNKNLEKALYLIREAGADMKDSVVIVKHFLQLGLSEADKLILHSDTWKDKKEATLKFRLSYVDALMERALNDENATITDTNITLNYKFE